MNIQNIQEAIDLLKEDRNCEQHLKDFLIDSLEELQRWRTDKINENINNVFANTSTLICHNCDHKDEYIEELEQRIEQYDKQAKNND